MKKNYFINEPLWYKDAVIYELNIKAFHDSNADGIGDFKGLTKKLNYLDELGITAIWLLPFYPSPLRDDGYDISDYFSIHPNYGTLKDFKEFLKESHKRGIRIITELVLNHTSDQHEWFQKARKSKPGSEFRNFYVWSDTAEKYKDARVIFKDFETSNWTWDSVAKAYFWHRFYSHQPDLNYAHPHVQNAMLKVINYWFDMGVDGMRLDAVPYLYEREGTNCENLPETYQFLKKLRMHVDGKYKDKMLLAEANQWPEDAAAYFGNGDACQMAFHFPLMPRMFMSIWLEDKFPIIDIFEQTPRIPENCQWALFLRNHDELTLEMVTDEERDYMYRVYAKDSSARINLGIRRRLAPLLSNHRRKIELMNFLLFSLPGTPVMYYGDEIGMGDNYYLGDRNGVRTPMQWNSDRNAGFSMANPQKLYLPIIIDPEYHYESVNVENSERNQSSLLWWMKRIVSMRKRFKSFGRGDIEFLHSDNPKVLAFIRKYQDESMLVVINLSRFSQAVELDLSKFAGYFPQEVFSRNRFPPIKDTPYIFTLGFYDYFWFVLRKKEDAAEITAQTIAELTVEGKWETVLQKKRRGILEIELLPLYLERCRWFRSKARKIQSVKILENIPIGKNSAVTHLLFLEVLYVEGLSETYLLPVCFASKNESEKIMQENPAAVISKLKCENTDGIIYEGTFNEEFRKNILLMIEKKGSADGLHGKLIAYPGKFLKTFFQPGKLLPPEKSQVLRVEQSNTSFLYEDKLFFKLFRKLEEGINPELEIGKFLTEKTPFKNTPLFAGAIEYRRPGLKPIVIGMLQSVVGNEGNAWKYSLDSLGRYYERVLAKKTEVQKMPQPPVSILEAAHIDIPPLINELVDADYFEMVRLLGKRTAELHLSLYCKTQDPYFTAEPFSALEQRSLYQSMRGLTKKVFENLRKNQKNLPESVRAEASELLNSEKEIISKFKSLLNKKISAVKMRIHGDYHLGQVLFTGNDFIIIDFEGEPMRSLSERRLKRSPLMDIAGMIRSFHYAAYTSLNKNTTVKIENISEIEQWAVLWYNYVAGAFLRSYFDTVKEMPFIPQDKEELKIMLDAFILEKAVYELGYEINNRPEWITIPIKGMKRLL
ncbi:MAG: maltose alpha-D-glucosyltransferase [Elusimicrobia bacterium]|nr:maltose alpha-D-glucosyltransferase [Elusimicrobiota bacterium]